MPRIGIFGRRSDVHVQALQKAIEARGAESVLIDFSKFPKLSLTSWGSEVPWRHDDILQQGIMDLHSLNGAIVRTTCFDEVTTWDPVDREAEDLRHFSRTQIGKFSFQLGLQLSLSKRIPVVNPPHAHLLHRQKARQHQLLKRAGLPTPSAIVTSDPSVAKSFVQSLGGRCVAKPQASGAEVVMADKTFFEENAGRITKRPFMFQQFVKGRSMRAYLLGGEIVAMGEILHDKSRVDWRENIDSITPYSPAPELTAIMRRAVKLLDLPHCGMDIEYDEFTDQFYLLDFNPSAYFRVAGRLMGIDLGDKIAEYILDVVQNGGQVWRQDCS